MKNCFRVLFLFTFVFLTINEIIAESQKPDKFKEALTIKPLSDGKLLTYFQFNVKHYGYKEGVAFSHYNFFPRAIGQILQTYNVRELHLTFTQGRWNYEDWGYPFVPSAGTGVELWAWLWKDGKLDKNWKSLTNALAGLFCASLNFIDDTITVQPKLSFRPEGPFNTTELAERAELRYGSLPHENVCTENLTPWIKLLPCKSTSGIASLLNGHKLYDSNFHSMSIHVRPSCEACPLAEESNLEVILPEHGDYKIIPDANVIIQRNTSNIDGGAEKKIAVYNLKKIKPNTELSMSWNEDQFEYSYGQERGGIKVNIFNKSPNTSIPIIYCDVIPWYLKLYLHTLKVQINGKDTKFDADHPIKDLYFQPAVDRSRPNVIEVEMLLPPNSLTTLSINFDKVFLKYTEHPPDANRGFDIGSGIISTRVIDDNFLSFDTEIMNNSNSTNILLTTKKSLAEYIYFPIRIYTETLLVSLPTPDFSMPYNVITLTCTVIALFFGSMFNLLTRSFVAFVDIEKEKAEKKIDIDKSNIKKEKKDIDREKTEPEIKKQ
ncbi:8749_t:CDS:10 [Cetraspora pellucida]|uniref:8749_t:CDS:1 n=1 Tax=Cetraspora pellucida TaxID=1433469 RepID=A0A9N8YTQ1_9GLOM|nr:8749_t:CDS:10 [Cetraspora pellucida]